jgi:TatD DNase family protein
LFFIDAHCHINSEQLREDAPGVVRRAAEAGVKRLLVAGSDTESSAEAVELARVYRNEGVYAAVGVHPHDAKILTGKAALPEKLLRLADDPRVAAIGETGLDYYYDHSPRDVQRDAFRLHIAWAARTGKPLVIHVREARVPDVRVPDAGVRDASSGRGAAENAAMEDALNLLRETPERNFPLLFHCYAGGLEYLDAMRELDAYLSIGGPVTWPKSDELRQTVSRIPEDRLLCETDSPWLTPLPHRGKTNEPAYVRFVYEAVAEARGLSADALARALDANASRLFGWGSIYGEAHV